MPTFEYLAIDSAGKKARGTMAAESAGAARRMLRERKLHATQLQPVSEVAMAGRWEWGAIFKARRRRDVLEFTRQLATMVESDVQLTEALGVLIAQSDNLKFKQIVQNIRDEVVSGDSLADGFKEYPNWFDTIYVSMVRVGEVTGNIGRSFRLLAEYMSKRQRLEAKVKSALTYPIILVVVGMIVTTILMTVVVPKMVAIIEQSGRELPGATQLLISMSGFMVSYWWGIAITCGVGYYLFRRGVATVNGRLTFDRVVLKIPVIGELIRQAVVARFASTLATLIRSGLPVAESLQVVAGVAGNAVMARAVHASRERIIAGADVATPLRESGVIGPAIAHMIAVGERTGELEAMLVTIAESVEERTDISVQRISSVIEPVIIVVMAVVVGFIMYATLLPILQVADMASL